MNLATCEPSGTGAGELTALWDDPDARQCERRLLSAGLGTPQMLLEHIGRDHEGLGHECQARADSRSKPVDPYRQAKLALGGSCRKSPNRRLGTEQPHPHPFWQQRIARSLLRMHRLRSSGSRQKSQWRQRACVGHDRSGVQSECQRLCRKERMSSPLFMYQFDLESLGRVDAYCLTTDSVRYDYRRIHTLCITSIDRTGE